MGDRKDSKGSGQGLVVTVSQWLEFLGIGCRKLLFLWVLRWFSLFHSGFFEKSGGTLKQFSVVRLVMEQD